MHYGRISHYNTDSVNCCERENEGRSIGKERCLQPVAFLLAKPGGENRMVVLQTAEKTLVGCSHGQKGTAILML